MKIYVITEGEYSDYHICAVTESKERAKALLKFFTGEWHRPNIEEYDTETFNPYFEGKKIYRVQLCRDRPPYIYTPDYMVDETDFMVSKTCTVYRDVYAVCVWAEDEEHALKIASDKIAEYKYRESVGEAK